MQNDVLYNRIMKKIDELEPGGGGGYDLVIMYDAVDLTCTIISGDILTCEDKIANGEMISGICFVKGAWSWTPSGANTNKEEVQLSLVSFSPPETSIFFGGAYISNDDTPVFSSVNICYSSSTGEITTKSWKHFRFE